MIEIIWEPEAGFEEALRRHLIDRGMVVVKKGIQIGFDAHYKYIEDWNHQPHIRGAFTTELYAINGLLKIEDVSDSWWWLVNDGGSTVPKGGGPLLPVRARKLQLATYSAKTDGGDGSRSNIQYRGMVMGPRVVEARDMLSIVEERVTPIIIDMARRSF